MNFRLVLLSLAFVLLLLGCYEQKQVGHIPTHYPTHTPYPKYTEEPTPVTTSIETASIPATKLPISAPKLQNLLIKNLGPYDSSNATFGDIKYDIRFGKQIFDEFGRALLDGHGREKYNPTFEFKVPADTFVVAPISGVLSYIEWQSREGDWEIHLKSDMASEWNFGIDHLVSIDCERSAKPVIVCDTPLRINGNVVYEGMSINAGDVVGYVGDYVGTGINGRTELMVFRYLDGYSGVMNYCPTLYLAEEVEDIFESAIVELMKSYEEWSGESSTYDQRGMVVPGCLYEAIKEVNGDIELIGPRNWPKGTYVPVPSHQKIADAVLNALSADLGVLRDSLNINDVKPVDWPNASLGCPKSGYVYAQVITPGYKLIIEFDGVLYYAHTDLDGSNMVWCDQK